MSVPGGTTQAKPVDDRVQQICQDIQPKVEEKLNAKFELFLPVLYKSQVVAGMNYFIKVKIDGGNHLHIRVYKPLQGELQLSGVQENKLEDDEIAYF